MVWYILWGLYCFVSVLTEAAGKFAWTFEITVTGPFIPADHANAVLFIVNLTVPLFSVFMLFLFNFNSWPKRSAVTVRVAHILWSFNTVIRGSDKNQFLQKKPHYYPNCLLQLCNQQLIKQKGSLILILHYT